MITYESVLTIDFGEVGYRTGKSPFRVRLETGPLAELIRATESAHRVYELLIDRPGDVWDYVCVALDEVPTRVADRVAHARLATESESPLKVDQLLDGDPAQRIIEAHRRAQSTRSQIL